MNLFFVLSFLFFIGSIIGWSLEVFYRRFFSSANPSRKWINPGFLIGPYLPLYGFSLCALFILSFINVSFISNTILQKIVLFILMAFCVTIIEFIAGIIFIHGMKIKLWDYSECRGNIMGIICPRFSLYWVLLSAIYYFLIHPRVIKSLYWLADHLTFCFVIGFFYGIFTIDFCYSLNVLKKIRKFAQEKQIVVRFEQFKEHIRKNNEEIKEKAHFLFALRSEKTTLLENLKHYWEKRTEELKIPLIKTKKVVKNKKNN